jgi:MFS-type transporter involved in bile tolerance (Atg22 family)
MRWGLGNVQAYIDGLPIFTQTAYGWTNSEVGIMLGILGLVAPIVNTIVGSLSSRFPDRYITVCTLAAALGLSLPACLAMMPTVQ